MFVIYEECSVIRVEHEMGRCEIKKGRLIQYTRKKVMRPNLGLDVWLERKCWSQDIVKTYSHWS